MTQYTKTEGKYTKLPQHYQMAVQFTQVGIFGLKTNHLATLTGIHM
jgi:hypothetical protein